MRIGDVFSILGPVVFDEKVPLSGIARLHASEGQPKEIILVVDIQCDI